MKAEQWRKFIGLFVLLPIVSGLVYACSRGGHNSPRQRHPQDTIVTSDQSAKEAEQMDTVFEGAVTSKGSAYLVAEETLRKGGEAAARVLRQKMQHPDPIGRLIGDCLLRWMEGRAPQYQEALDYLDYIPKRLAKTPAGVPQPTGVANDLSERFGARVADFLSLRLVKSTDWPTWKSFGVLFYLKEQAERSTTPALIRFAVETDDDQSREAAIDAIRAIQDPEFSRKLEVERQRAEKQGKEFPAALDNL